MAQPRRRALTAFPHRTYVPDAGRGGSMWAHRCWRARFVAMLVLVGLLAPAAALSFGVTPATAVSASPSVAGGGFVAVTPARVLDTSAAAGATLKLTVLGVGGVPASG